MPQPLQVDRQYVKALFLQGLPPAEVSRQTGVNVRTIETWARREQWRVTRAKTKHALEQSVKPALVEQVAKEVTDASNRVREKLSQVVEGHAELLQKNPPKSISELIKVAGTTETVVKSAAKLHGWDNQSGKSLVNVQVLGSVRVSGVDDVD